MDKRTEPIDLDFHIQTPRFLIKPDSVAPSHSGIKVLPTIDEAFKAFDQMEEDPKIQFVVKNQSPIVPPPIPPEEEVQEYFMKNALLLIDGGEYSLARRVLSDVLRKSSNHVEAIRWMGWCFKQEGDLENALKCYRQLAQRRVTEQDLFELGEVYYGLKRDTEAQMAWMDALSQCDAESPRLFDLHKNLGNVFTRLGDYESAEENYNKALTLRPQSDTLQVNLGSLQFQRQNFQLAMEHFKRGIEYNPYNDRAWCGVALVAREMKDDEWARSLVLKALDINKTNLTALQILINWAQADFRWDEAIERIQEYLSEDQSNAEIIYSLAGLYFQKGLFQEAEMELIRLEALSPGREDTAELQKLIRQKRDHGH